MGTTHSGGSPEEQPSEDMGPQSGRLVALLLILGLCALAGAQKPCK